AGLRVAKVPQPIIERTADGGGKLRFDVIRAGGMGRIGAKHQRRGRVLPNPSLRSYPPASYDLLLHAVQVSCIFPWSVPGESRCLPDGLEDSLERELDARRFATSLSQVPPAVDRL